MSTIQVSRVVPHAPVVVWEELRHIDRHVNWMSDAVRIDFVTDQHEGVGTAFNCVTKVGPIVLLDKMHITSWVENAAMGVEHRGLVRGSGSFTLSSRGTGTLIAWREELYFPWWMGGSAGAFVASPILAALWRKNLRNFAATLPS
jgi:hypothetical protein